MASDPTPPSAPLQRRSLAQQVADRLRQSIASGRLRPGSALRQTALAREFGVSVIPLREALRQLEGEGLVTSEPHRGVIVAAFDAEDVEELVRIFCALETLALERSIPRLGDDDLRAAKTALEAVRKERDANAIADSAWELRMAFLRSADSPRLLHLLDALNKSNRRYYALLVREPELRQRMLEHWTQRIELGRKRDVPGMLALVERHAKDSIELLRRLLPPTPREASEEGA